MVSWQMGCEMSRKEYIEAYKFMTDGINHDGHSWVTYGDVERVVGKIILGRTKGGENDAFFRT